MNKISIGIKKQISFEETNDADFYNNRANTKYFSEDYLGVIQDCNRVIELDSMNSSAYKLRGIANRKLKNYNDALRDYSKAIELDPNDPQAYIFRGDAKFALGDKNGGCFDLDKAGELCSAHVYQ